MLVNQIYVASSMMMVSSSLRTTTQSECCNWNNYCMKVQFALYIFIYSIITRIRYFRTMTSLQHIFCPSHIMLHSIFLSHTLHTIQFQRLAESGGGGTPSVGCSCLRWIAPAFRGLLQLPSVGCSCHYISEMKWKSEKRPTSRHPMVN